jgi:hypothetical protein
MGCLVLLQNVARNARVLASGQQIVETGRVDDLGVASVENGLGAGDLHRGAGEVGDRDVVVGEIAEENALAHVGVADEHYLLADHAAGAAAGGGGLSVLVWRRGGHGRASRQDNRSACILRG